MSTARKPRVLLTHTYSPEALRYVAKMLYEIMLDGFLCLTKPSKRAVRGAVLLTPASMQGCFCVVRLAAHVSNGLKSRIRPVVGRI